LARHLPEAQAQKKPIHPVMLRIGMALALGAIWLGAIWTLLRGPKSRTYLSLMLAWAVLPIILQVAFGGDILWQQRGLGRVGGVPGDAVAGHVGRAGDRFGDVDDQSGKDG